MNMYYLLILFFLSSCSLYKTHFDCPVEQDITCTSVTSLERMIVESPCGPDVIVGCIPKPVEKQHQIFCQHATMESEPLFERRIWIAPKDGEPAYIYFPEGLCEEQ